MGITTAGTGNRCDADEIVCLHCKWTYRSLQCCEQVDLVERLGPERNSTTQSAVAL